MPQLEPRAQEKTSAAGSVLQLVSFKVGNEEFGLDILKVQEIIRLRELTHVPNMPDFVDGVINLRGKVIPVIGLRRRLGIPAGEADKRTRIVVTEVNGRVLGFVVDEVSEVLRISEDTVEPAPKLGQVEREYVRGIGKIEDRLLILIDLNPLISDAEESQIAAASPEQVETVQSAIASAGSREVMVEWREMNLRRLAGVSKAGARSRNPGSEGL